MKRTKLTLVMLASLVTIGTANEPAMAQTKAAANPLDPQTIAVEAYVYLYPLVLMDVTRQQMTKMLLSEIGNYGIDYRQRAAVALFGLGANQLADAIYPLLLTDARGKPLKGTADYVLHFDKDELPPADAFWSITLYDHDGFPVPNPMNRGNLSNWMPLKYNTDGSLDLYFQADSPGKDKQANWLPAPKQGTWNLTLRLYAPRPEVAKGTWNPPAIERVSGGHDLRGADGLPVHRRK